jgi:hypothetical protein
VNVIAMELGLRSFDKTLYVSGRNINEKIYDHEDGFTELKMKKPNGMFAISHETNTGI